MDGHLTMITQEGEVRMQTPLCGRGQEEWVPALRDVIETNDRSMGGVDPSIAKRCRKCTTTDCPCYGQNTLTFSPTFGQSFRFT